MARLYIGYNQLGPQVFRNVRKDKNRRPFIVMEEGAQEDIVLDFTGYLETSETVSSAATSDISGITVLSPTVATPKVTLTLSNPDSHGEFTVTTTMSSGSKQVTKLRTRRLVDIDETIETRYAC